MERASTGISGFDSLIEGGLPRGSTILVTGAPGTGKTIFALHYLCEGAAKGENGIYVVIDSGLQASLDLLREQARELNLPVDKYEKEGKLVFLTVPLDQRKFSLFSAIEETKDRIKARRVVFDSMTTFITNMDLFSIPIGYAGAAASRVEGSAANALSNIDLGGKVSYQSDPEKRLVYLGIEMIRRLGTTNVVVGYGREGPDGQQTELTLDGVSEFACDGVIAVYNSLIGAKRIRTLSIIKMRDTNHSPYIHNFDITGSGIVVQPAEQVYK